MLYFCSPVVVVGLHSFVPCSSVVVVVLGFFIAVSAFCEGWNGNKGQWSGGWWVG